MITERGSFIINGAERVIVSQLHRSPGIAFEESVHTSGKILPRLPHHSRPWHMARSSVRPERSSLRLPRPPPSPSQVPDHHALLRAMGYSSDADILNLFYSIDEIKVAEALKREMFPTLFWLKTSSTPTRVSFLHVPSSHSPRRSSVLSRRQASRRLSSSIDTTVDDGAIIRCLKKDPTQNEEEALKDIYKRLRPGEPPTTANARLCSSVSSKIHAVMTSVVSVATRSTKSSRWIPTSSNRIVNVEDMVEATRIFAASSAAMAHR